VISGFIMVHITSKKPAGLKSSVFFVVERLTRILPTYYIALFFAFYLSWEVGFFVNPEKIQNIISALTFTPYMDTYPPLYVDAGGLFVVRWTLNYELYFYLIFSLCLLFNKRISGMLIWVASTALLGVALTSSFTLSTAGYKTGSPLLSFLTNPIIAEFFIGILAGYTIGYAKLWSERQKKNIHSNYSFNFLYMRIQRNDTGI